MAFASIAVSPYIFLFRSQLPVGHRHLRLERFGRPVGHATTMKSWKARAGAVAALETGNGPRIVASHPHSVVGRSKSR